MNPKFKLALVRRARVLAVLAVLMLLLPLLSPWLALSTSPTWASLLWLLDLASHWQWLSLVGLAVALVPMIAVNWRNLGWLVVLPLPWLTASEPLPRVDRATGPVLTLASANLYFENPQVEPLFTWLRAVKPDLLVLLELSPEYANQLTRLADYPYQHLVPEPGPFGIAVLSRYPLSSVQVRRDAADIARIETQVVWQGRPIRLTAVHPMPPITANYHQIRNELLRQVAQASQASGLPALMVGDFNASPWSSALAGLSQFGFRRSSSLQATWPTSGLGPLGIPIDQVLASPDWALLNSQNGPNIGSDHWPVLVQLVLKPD